MTPQPEGLEKILDGPLRTGEKGLKMTQKRGWTQKGGPFRNLARTPMGQLGGEMLFTPHSLGHWAHSVVEDTKLVVYKDEREVLKLKKVNQGSQPRKAWYLVCAGGGDNDHPREKILP